MLTPHSARIIRCLDCEFPKGRETPPNDKGQTTTQLIMEALTHLGDKLRYCVYSHGLSIYFKPKQGLQYFKNREWLFDLHWFTQHKKCRTGLRKYGYRLKTVPLVVECEWDWIRAKEREQKKEQNKAELDPFGEVKYDFQKLLLANANLRLMIFRKRTRAIRELPQSRLKAQKPEECNAELDTYFIRTIREYEYFSDRAYFLFIRFDGDVRKKRRLSFEYAIYPEVRS